MIFYLGPLGGGDPKKLSCCMCNSCKLLKKDGGRSICLFRRSAKNSSGKRNHKQLSNVPSSAVSWRY